jgi:hypothetical protein
MSVDKSVEIGGHANANYTILSSLNRFAQFRCRKILNFRRAFAMTP